LETLVVLPLYVLAHGAAGIWDEALPIGLAIIFTAILIWVWRKGRGFEPEMDEHNSEDEQG
jgi:hypothetical protein